MSEPAERSLGTTGLRVSPVSFGAGHIAEADAKRLLPALPDLGIRLVDTAPSYGESEALVGRYLGSSPNILISTKVGYGVDGVEDWTPECIRRGIEKARATLRRDVIDIVHLHSCPVETLETPGVIDALLEAQEAGKIGVAAYSGDNEALSWALDRAHFASFQTSVSVCDTAAIERLPGDRGLLVKRPLANAPWRFAERPDAHDLGIYWDRWQRVRTAFDGLDPAEAALRFAAWTPGVDSILVGTRRPERLQLAVEAVARGPLAPELRSAIGDRNEPSWRQVT